MTMNGNAQSSWEQHGWELPQHTSPNQQNWRHAQGVLDNDPNGSLRKRAPNQKWKESSRMLWGSHRHHGQLKKEKKKITLTNSRSTAKKYWSSWREIWIVPCQHWPDDPLLLEQPRSKGQTSASQGQNLSRKDLEAVLSRVRQHPQRPIKTKGEETKLPFLPTPDPRSGGISCTHFHCLGEQLRKEFYFSNNNRNQTGSRHQRYTNTNSLQHTTRFCLAVFLKQRFLKAQLQTNQASSWGSRKTKGMYSGDLRKLCVISGLNAFLKLKSNGSECRKWWCLSRSDLKLQYLFTYIQYIHKNYLCLYKTVPI